MKLTKTTIDGLFVLEPTVYGDSRGYFYESWNERLFEEAVGLSVKFVQDNHSRSQKGVLRGLHYQRQQVQGKLVRVTAGRVWDVAVDLRKDSPSFGAWWGTELSETNHRQLWVPQGMAHGFLVLSDMADFLYKTTDYWHAPSERSVLWNDPDIGIEWPLDQLAATPEDAASMLKLAAKDRDALRLSELQQRGELEMAR
ncbi:MAG: dTDP-4-dehydrorhamnose 3,5-epimerase [Betaproteobacteria bacterium]|nr:dTDP-4-dehydrorhamnose 3,5-epimerase [Betaproteobacteria bacterium]